MPDLNFAVVALQEQPHGERQHPVAVRKRQGLAYQAGEALMQGVIEALNATCTGHAGTLRWGQQLERE